MKKRFSYFQHFSPPGPQQALKATTSLLFNVKAFDVRVKGNRGCLLPLRSLTARVSSSSEYRVSSSPLRPDAVAGREILEGRPASWCPLGAERGSPAPPVCQY